MTCSTCKFKTCFLHKMLWHPDQTCSEYEVERKERMDQEAASEGYLAKESQICGNPECKIHISKVDGCDHMTCKSLFIPYQRLRMLLIVPGTKCTYQFCFLCRASWRQILAEGNTAHATNYKYHSVNLPVGIAWGPGYEGYEEDLPILAQGADRLQV